MGDPDMIVFDAHCDAPSQMYRLRDFGVDNAFAQVDFPKMRRGGVDASFFALYVPPTLDADAAFGYAQALLGSLQVQLDRCPQQVALATTKESLEENIRKELISIFIGIENGTPLLGGAGLAANLKDFYQSRVRYVTLVHSRDNALGDSCAGPGLHGGLSELGREAVAEMNRLGMLIDLAHAAPATISDVLDCSKRPVAFTHGCCAALHPHKRNLSDAQLRAIAEKGGFAGISIYPDFLSGTYAEELARTGLGARLGVEDAFIEDPADAGRRTAWEAVQRQLQALPRPGADCVARHIDHAVRVAGIGTVGIGTDYDGIEVAAAGLEDISGFSLIFDALRRLGYKDDALEKIAGANLLRVLEDNQH